MKKIFLKLKSLSSRKDQEGAGLVEYALLVALISVVAMVGMYSLGKNINNLFVSMAGVITNPTGTANG